MFVSRVLMGILRLKREEVTRLLKNYITKSFMI
jgi:hypothetical protein